MRAQGTLALSGAVALAFAFGTIWLWRSAEGKRLRQQAPGRPFGISERLALTAIYASLLSTLVFRVRGTADIAANPLDTAGTYRAGMLALAALSAGLSILASTERGRTPSFPGPVWLFIAYTAVVLAGMPLASARGFVAFRFVELATFLLVWLSAYIVFQDNPLRPFKHVLLFIGLLSASVGVGVFLFGGQAVRELGGVIPIQIQGVTPALSANTVGLLGMTLYASALGRAWARQGASVLAGSVGLALVVLSQYRTGYVGLAAITLVWAAVTRRLPRALSMAIAVPVGWAIVQTPRFEELWLRGAPAHLAQTMSGRTDWWELARQTWRTSPLVGLGLSSGTRFDVFTQLGRGETSTIHGTWVEALLGTGLLGVVLLGAAFIAAIALSLRSAWRTGHCLPLLLLTGIGVRSLTGTTIEMASITLLLFLFATSLSWQATIGYRAGAAARVASTPVDHLINRTARGQELAKPGTSIRGLA